MFTKLQRIPYLALGLVSAALLAVAVLALSTSRADAQAVLGHRRLDTSTTFIRWGNSTAPSGTRLIYSGFAYSSNYSHSGQNTPIVVQGGDGGPAASLNGNLLYPLQTAMPGFMPPGITPDCEVVAAVCEAPDLTTTIWGTHTAPPGWTVLYRGYTMGPYYTQGGVIGPLCVDTDAFDASFPADLTQNARGLLYATELERAADGSGDAPGGFVKCAVIMRD